MNNTKYRSVFTPATDQQRKENFDDYWIFTQQHGGQLLEEEKDLLEEEIQLRKK